jgi:hypothetical protein
MANVTPLFIDGSAASAQVTFDRRELQIILDLYGRLVAAGLFRDYAIRMERDIAVFSAFERATEKPEVQIIKQPELARAQGAYALISRSGVVLKRGSELRSVLAVLERKLLKAVAQ